MQCTKAYPVGKKAKNIQNNFHFDTECLFLSVPKNAFCRMGQEILLPVGR
jgi:hypothetical protein